MWPVSGKRVGPSSVERCARVGAGYILGALKMEGVILANEDGRIMPDYAKSSRFLHLACRGSACESCGLNMPASHRVQQQGHQEVGSKDDT